MYVQSTRNELNGLIEVIDGFTEEVAESDVSGAAVIDTIGVVE